MSSFLWRGQDNRRLFNQSMTREEYERRQARHEASRKAKEDKQTTPVFAQVKTFVKNVFSNVKRFFSRGKH